MSQSSSPSVSPRRVIIGSTPGAQVKERRAEMDELETAGCVRRKSSDFRLMAVENLNDEERGEGGANAERGVGRGSASERKLRRGCRRAVIEDRAACDDEEHPQNDVSERSPSDPSPLPLVNMKSRLAVLSNVYEVKLKREKVEGVDHDNSFGVHFYIPPPASSFESSGAG